MNGSKSQKPMDRSLESHVDVPNGGRAARCQAVRKNGDQCKKAARVGFHVCGTHGAGYAKREAEGVSKPTGAPMVHGRFASTNRGTLLEMLAELQQDEIDLDNTDDALRLVYAVLNRTLTLEPDVTELQAQLTFIVENTPLDPLVYVDAANALDKLSRFMLSVHQQAVEIIKLGKVRADTYVRLSHARAQDDFIENTRILSDVVCSHTSPKVFDTIMHELQVKVLGPMGVTAEDFENRVIN